MYDLMFECIQEKYDNSEITFEQALLYNDIAYDRYVTEGKKKVLKSDIILNSNEKGLKKIPNKIVTKILNRNFYEAIVPDNKLEEVTKLIDILNNTKKYKDYKKAFSQFCRIFGVPKYAVIQDTKLAGNKITFKIIPFSGKEGSINGKYLVHHKLLEVEKLKPTFRSYAGRSWYPTMRVYMYYKFEGLDRRFSLYDTKNENNHLYRLKNAGTYTIYADPETGGNACYVNTEVPLKVEEIPKEEVEKMIKNLPLKTKIRNATTKKVSTEVRDIKYKRYLKKEEKRTQEENNK